MRSIGPCHLSTLGLLRLFFGDCIHGTGFTDVPAGSRFGTEAASEITTSYGDRSSSSKLDLAESAFDVVNIQNVYAVSDIPTAVIDLLQWSAPAMKLYTQKVRLSTLLREVSSSYGR